MLVYIFYIYTKTTFTTSLVDYHFWFQRTSWFPCLNFQTKISKRSQCAPCALQCFFYYYPKIVNDQLIQTINRQHFDISLHTLQKHFAQKSSWLFILSMVSRMILSIVLYCIINIKINFRSNLIHYRWFEGKFKHNYL